MYVLKPKFKYRISLCLTGVELQLRMAGDSRVLMDHNMEIGVTPAQVKYLVKHCIIYDILITTVSPQQEETV